MPLRSVLIIDDSEFDRYMLRQQLLAEDIASDILELENGQKALDYFNAEGEENHHYPPELIFVDANMPIMNGEEFLTQFEQVVTQQPDLETSTLLMFTSSDCEREEIKGKFKGVTGYINKMPSSSEELKHQLLPHFPTLN